MCFMDLFLTRERWKTEDIKPYLSDIAVDTKTLTSCYSSMREPGWTKMAHGIRCEPDELEKEHFSSLFLHSSILQYATTTIYLYVISSEHDFI